MTRRETLDDGSVSEDLVVDVDGKTHRGTLTIKRIDKTKSSFDVAYGDHYHTDTSVFPHAAEDQMRLHARFILKGMVEDDLKRKKHKEQP